MSLSFHHFKLLTYNLHHSRDTTTDSLAGVIGWAGVGPSITRPQKRLASRITTITVIITTRHKAAAACWSPAISYLTSCTQSSASQGDSWCCSVVWRLVAFLKWSVADVNHNLEGWRKLATGCESLSLLQTCHPRMNCFFNIYRLCQLDSTLLIRASRCSYEVSAAGLSWLEHFRIQCYR